MRGFFLLIVLSLFIGGCFPILQKTETMPNAEESVEQIRAKAEQGDAAAQFNLGVMYYEGRSVQQDYNQAAAWYRKAAEQGHAKAQFNLGMMYDEGQGVQQNYTQAAAWYRKAAEQGHAKAQFNLGVMYKKGQGVPQDYAQAYMWVNLAAAKGLENAVKTRDNLVKKLTPSQIEEGQKLAREWIAMHTKAQTTQ
jgi:uncharacterized protein